MKLTFKKEPRETGLAGMGNNPNTLIKHNKKEIGTIIAPTWRDDDHKYGIMFAVKDADSWRWVTLKGRFDTEPQAREFIQDRLEAILEKNNFVLYYFEED